MHGLAVVSQGLLKPLGDPSANGTKYFATADLLETSKGRCWLVKMTTAINSPWQRQNLRKRGHANGERKGLSVLEIGDNQSVSLK